MMMKVEINKGTINLLIGVGIGVAASILAPVIKDALSGDAPVAGNGGDPDLEPPDFFERLGLRRRRRPRYRRGEQRRSPDSAQAEPPGRE